MALAARRPPRYHPVMEKERRGSGASSGTSARATAAHPAPGKTTLVQLLPAVEAATPREASIKWGPAPSPPAEPVGPLPPDSLRSSTGSDGYGTTVQARGDLDGPHVHQAAARGVSGTPTALPFRHTIQSLFGRHDVSGVGAHVGGAAEHATRELGATAYATGDQVAFGAAPDLHTAAHEAAHVVQQRAGVQLAGGVGQRGDTYEQHADAVADAVVAGKSAEALLDPFAHGGGGGAAVQRNAPLKPAAPIGRAELIGLARYWVVPDGTGPQAGVADEQMSETSFAALKATWDKLNSGTGQIKINETGDDGTKYAGFKAKMITQFGLLLSKPAGRAVVMSLISAGHTVTIIPSAPRTIGGARRGAGSVEKPDGSANTGGDSTILIEAGLTDTDIVCFDPAGNKISAPIFLILGHELIHATHNDAGRNHREKAAADGAAYPNLEEEETIATGAGATENKLRAEHGLGVRKGHALQDTRPAP
jgi:hypothetical protein